MNKWLMLRGEWDCRTQKSIDHDDDMWVQLFSELVGKSDIGVCYFYDKTSEKNKSIRYNENVTIIVGDNPCAFYDSDIVFSRGGFGWQANVLKNFTTSIKIRYGAGRRFMPEQEIRYDLILVDSGKQFKAVKQKYPSLNVQLLIKSASKHFRYLKCEKEYDVCFIAKDEQANFKGVKWVYDTVPSNLKVLHLGSNGKFNPPKNITCKYVDRKDMPFWINKCYVGIVPYWNEIDSCPRILPEMTACSLPCVVSDVLHYNKNVQSHVESCKEYFWNSVTGGLIFAKVAFDGEIGRMLYEGYLRDMSLQVSAQSIRQQVGLNEG